MKSSKPQPPPPSTLLNRPTLKTWKKQDLIQYILSNGKRNPLNKQKPHKKIDMQNYHFVKMAFKFGYLGWDYHGLAAQKDIQTTIQHHLFQALKKTKVIQDQKSCKFQKSGRTDKGVSAVGNCFSLFIRTNKKKDKSSLLNSQEEDKEGESTTILSQGEKLKLINDYCKMLNRLLPQDIRITAGSVVKNDFSARFNSKHREYKYFFTIEQENLNIDKMKAAAAKLVGQHDFRNFCKKDPTKEQAGYTRTIYKLDIELVNSYNDIEIYMATIKGTAFLWHQIRCIMAVLFRVGSGEKDLEYVDLLLDIVKTPERPNYKMANELPLILSDVGYDEADVKFVFSQQNQIDLINLMQVCRFLKNDRVYGQKRITQMAIKMNQQSLFLHSLNGIMSQSLLKVRSKPQGTNNQTNIFQLHKLDPIEYQNQNTSKRMKQ